MSVLRHANLHAARASDAIREKELTYAFHLVFDPVVVINWRVAYVALQRRLGILS